MWSMFYCTLKKIRIVELQSNRLRVVLESSSAGTLTSTDSTIIETQLLKIF